MTPEVEPAIHRRAVRVILVRPDERILLICGQDPATGRRVWVMPGGGIEPGETIHEAAARELHEETGIELDASELAGPVWSREHEFSWDSRAYAYEEWFVVARLATMPVVVPFPGTPGEAAGMVAMEWASVLELLDWPDVTAPRRLPELLPAILAGELPAEPIPTGT